MSQVNATQANPAPAVRTPSTEIPGDTEKVKPLTPAQAHKAELNASIMQAQLDVSIQSKNEPMALLYKTAIEGINQELKAELGDDAIQKAYDSGVDVSPEATADRIVQFSTAFFSAYQGTHPGDDLETQLNNFIDLVGGGAAKGINEARDILDGLGVLEGEIAENIDKTYDLVFEGYEKFKQAVLGAQQDTLEA